MHAVRLNAVTKTYGKQTAVDALDLAVPHSSIYGFIGPNGSGKTTAIRMILHIIHPDSGEVEVLGKTGLRAANDEIGYLPEERGLYRKMTVDRLLAYFGTLKGLTKRDAADAGANWLDRLGLGDAGGKKIEALSKGMAQKVQFIAAVIARPKLLILDEPFSGLDPVNLELVRDQVLALRDAGTTVIFSTHDMAAAESLCDYIFMIHRGKKVLDGPPGQIMAKHGTQCIRVAVEGGATVLRGIKGIRSVRDLGRFQEIDSELDPRETLGSLVATTRVDHFEIKRPSLRDIFVSIAGTDDPGNRGSP